MLGVETFMRDYFRHTRGVAQVVETLVAGLRRPNPARAFVSGVLGNRVDGLFRVGPHDVAAMTGCLPQVTGSLDSIVRLVELAMLYDLPIDHATWAAVRTQTALCRQVCCAQLQVNTIKAPVLALSNDTPAATRGGAANAAAQTVNAQV
jgi:hypothetical protein